MLSKDKINELRELLEKTQNPLFFFDNDSDGLCSFIILQRALNKGKGIPIKSYPDLSEKYVKKVQELNPDSIIILDKADVNHKFIESVSQQNIPIIWIDHHKSNTLDEYISKTHYFNTYPEAEPVTYIAQKIYNRSQDRFFAMIGCIFDVYIPDFAKEFEKQYPELFNSKLDAFDALHLTEIGKFSLMLNFGLMNTTTNVVKLIKYLERINSPYDLLEENYYTKEFHKRYNELNKELTKLINKAKIKNKDEKILFFSYEGQNSMSGLLANKLYFLNKDKLIIVAYKKPDKINLSIRGENALKFTKKMLEKIEGSSGGGHENATGAMIPITQYEKLLELIRD
ncbi:MAG: DHH family phosphoesterase [Candidatus Nanoarchaeia archaeon]|nr:DHH family phosphoesterase [Candidatus Nanoarchaeia archaeon]